MAFTYRSVKGSLLTAEEVDANFLEVETLHDATEGFKENAKTSALNASASKDKAQKWAENPEDVEVEVGQYSAKHYSIKASEFTGPWETWQGDWVAGAYSYLDGVTHSGSSFIANKNTSEEPSLSAVDWDLLAEKGDQGEQGIQGVKGDTGEPFRVDAVGTIAGRPSHVSKPIGFSYLATDTGNLYLVTATGWSDAIPFGKGEKGDQGVAGEITSASASTGAAGSSVTVSLGGTPSKRTMAFTIPRGDKGEKGDPGEDSTGIVIGTTAGTACAGNDSRLSNSRKCNNTFDDTATARTNLGLGSKALGEQTISTNEPSGGSHGDVWYKI